MQQIAAAYSQQLSCSHYVNYAIFVSHSLYTSKHARETISMRSDGLGGMSKLFVICIRLIIGSAIIAGSLDDMRQFLQLKTEAFSQAFLPMVP